MVEAGRRYISGVLRVPPDLPLALMDVAIGLLLIVGGHQRSSGPAFTVAKALAPIQVWGLLFVLVGGTLMIALRLPDKQGYISFVRITGPSLCVMWALMYLISGLQNPSAAFIGVPVYLYLAFRHHFAPAKPVG